MFTAMKKIYQNPEIDVVALNGGAICQTLVIGSGKSDSGSGDGVDLVKERHEDVSGGNGRGGSYNVWGDDWSN